MLTGNKGEWSEVYTLLKLLGEGKLFAADDNLEPREDLYFPLVKIVRDEPSGKHVELIIDNESKTVSANVNGTPKTIIQQRVLLDEANYLLEELKKPHDSAAFPVERIEYALVSLGCEKIKAASSDKTDITLQLHDPQTGYNPYCGFSIKSEIGNASTLLNATRATNFTYKVNGLTEKDIEFVNSIEGGKKIIERMDAIFSRSRSVMFQCVSNPVFAENLMFIDSRMDEILAEALIVHYRDGVKRVSNVIDVLEEDNPLGFPVEGLYRYKMKKFLAAVALGFQPGRHWDGKDEANGGYIIVTAPGDAVAYHTYNRDLFEEYLLDSTNFERGSTTRHDFASLFLDGKNVFLNLNLQIRF